MDAAAFLFQWKPYQKSYAMHKLEHAWGQDRLEADGKRQLSSLATELMADATAENQIDPSYQLRLVLHVMASFGMFVLCINQLILLDKSTSLVRLLKRSSFTISLLFSRIGRSAEIIVVAWLIIRYQAFRC